jgi:hypothetical protein
LKGSLWPWRRAYSTLGLVVVGGKGEFWNRFEAAAVILLQDQLNAILNAPIPFLVVCGVALGVAWGAMQWIYKARIDKIKDLFELSKPEVELKTRISARVEEELNEKFKRLEEKVEIQNLPPEARALFQSIELKLSELKQANNAVSVAVSRSTPWTPSSGARSGFGASNHWEGGKN